MADIKELLSYLIKNYPDKSELSKARVTKMVYLCDWKSAIENGKQITNISWYYDNYGPFVRDVIDVATSNPSLFSVSESQNAFGTSKTIVTLKTDDYSPVLTDDEQKIADHVINITKNKTWSGFIKLVYSTFPVVNSPQYTEMNLPELASQYKKII